MANGIHMQHYGAPFAQMSNAKLALDPGHMGVAALSYYAPNLCLGASSAEEFHVSPGRYTLGRG